MNKIFSLNKTAKESVDVALIQKAIDYAIKYHGEQKRDTGEPFYSHPLEVAYMVADNIFNTDVLAIAILHDSIEDTILTKQMIAMAFNENIAQGVYDLTKIKEDGTKITVVEMVKQLYIEGKKELLTIKLFDRVHNMQMIEGKPLEKRHKTADETAEYFFIISEMLERRNVTDELTDIIFKLKHPQDLNAYSMNEALLHALAFENNLDQNKKP